MAGAVRDDAHARPDESKSLVRFITCGSVDDGKSTLIGRLLYESDQIYDDELSALAADSRRFGTQRNELDLALLLDGLDAERQQGITIDVAYRYFASRHRHFIIADTPGHEQYTRNMVTGASTADVAVILVDVRKGLLTQTRRHAHLVSLLGIRRIVIAVNKLDLVDYAKPVFDAIDAQCRAFARTLGVGEVTCIPMSALKGDNVTTVSARMAWYPGPSLLTYLDEVDVKTDLCERPFRMPVQWVNRPGPDFRGYAGRIVSGSLRAGERVRILPAGSESSISRIATADGNLERATAGRSVTVTLDDEVDVSRGDMIVAAESPARIADQFEATLVWMSGEEMLPGRSYLLKACARTVAATPASPKYKVNVDTLEHLAAKTLTLNDIGVCNLHLDQPIAFDPYLENRETGAFILIDRFTNDTVAAGMLHFALRRARNIHWQAVDVDKHAHARLKGQRACIVWFTGLSGAGKSTIANLVEKKLHAMGKHTYLLDGDNVRHGLSKDLGFTQADRVENVRRVAEVARLMIDAGLIVMVAFISPFRAERELARRLVDAGEFFEVHVDVPVDVAERRDRKGLYAKARRGELTNFTGIDSPYETPERPEVRIDTVQTSPEAAADAIIERLSAAGMFRPG